MVNQVVLVGRMGKDPELKYTPSGVAVASFSLAVNRPFKSKETGDYETDWFNVVVWRQEAEFTANYMAKGRLVAVQGRLQTRSWVAQDGTKRSVVEIVAERVTGLDKPKEHAGGGAPAPGEEQAVGAAAGAEAEADYDPFAEE